MGPGRGSRYGPVPRGRPAALGISTPPDHYCQVLRVFCDHNSAQTCTKSADQALKDAKGHLCCSRPGLINSLMQQADNLGDNQSRRGFNLHTCFILDDRSNRIYNLKSLFRLKVNFPPVVSSDRSVSGVVSLEGQLSPNASQLEYGVLS